MISPRRVSRDAREARWLAPKAYFDSLDDLDALESFAAGLTPTPPPMCTLPIGLACGTTVFTLQLNCPTGPKAIDW